MSRDKKETKKKTEVKNGKGDLLRKGIDWDKYEKNWENIFREK